jgi:hypothetical protein
VQQQVQPLVDGQSGEDQPAVQLLHVARAGRAGGVDQHLRF